MRRKALKRQKLSSRKTVIRRLRLSTRLLTLCAEPFRDDNKASRVISLAVWKALGTAVSLPAAFLYPRPFWDPCLLKQQLRSFSAQWKIATSFKLSRNSARILPASAPSCAQQLRNKHSRRVLDFMKSLEQHWEDKCVEPLTSHIWSHVKLVLWS